MRVGWDSSDTVMRENCCDTTRHAAGRATLRGDAGKCQRATGGERGEVGALVEDVFSGVPLTIQQQFAICHLPFALCPFDVAGAADSSCHFSHGQIEGGLFNSSSLEASLQHLEQAKCFVYFLNMNISGRRIDSESCGATPWQRLCSTSPWMTKPSPQSLFVSSRHQLS